MRKEDFVSTQQTHRLIYRQFFYERSFLYSDYIAMRLTCYRECCVYLNVSRCAAVDCFKPLLTRSTFESNSGQLVNDRGSNQIPVAVHNMLDVNAWYPFEQEILQHNYRSIQFPKNNLRVLFTSMLVQFTTAEKILIVLICVGEPLQKLCAPLVIQILSGEDKKLVFVIHKAERFTNSSRLQTSMISNSNWQMLVTNTNMTGRSAS